LRAYALERADTSQPRRHNVQRFRGGLVFKAHKLVYHSTLGSRVIKKKKSVVTPHQGMLSATCRARNKTQRSMQSGGSDQRMQCHNHFTEMFSGSEPGSYLRLIDSCVTQIKAQ